MSKIIRKTNKQVLYCTFAGAPEMPLDIFLLNCVWHVTCETACHVPHYINCGKFHSLDVNSITLAD